MSSKKVWSADNQQVSRKISDEYLAGFVEGEGCFYIGFSKRKDLPLGWQIITEFRLSQNPGGKNILEIFRKRLDCGIIKRNHPKNPKDESWVLVVRNRNDLKNKIIPFFQKHPLYSQKRQEFLVFSKVLKLVEEKKHLTKEGFAKVVRLVFSLGRKTKKKYLPSDLLTTSETIRQTSAIGGRRYSPNSAAMQRVRQK
jgi:hypothetical protein